MHQGTMTMEQLTELRGSPVYSRDGEKIGSVEEVFYDADTRQPEWIGIGTGFFGMKRVLVPVQGASMDADGVTVPYTKDHVKDTPSIDGDEISEETERQLYGHYGLQASDARSDSTLPEGGAGTTGMATEYGTTGTTDYGTTGTADYGTTGTADYGTGTTDRIADREGERSITRSEEELAVGKREMETGRVRLRKWVETEPVQAEVTLERETARVERQPINEVVSGGQIGEDEIDVTLRGEEAVVDKQVVARERIGLDKDVESRVETVSDEVRKERVEVEGDDASTTGRTGTTGSSRSEGIVDRVDDAVDRGRDRL